MSISLAVGWPYYFYSRTDLYVVDMHMLVNSSSHLLHNRIERGLVHFHKTIVLFLRIKDASDFEICVVVLQVRSVQGGCKPRQLDGNWMLSDGMCAQDSNVDQASQAIGVMFENEI